MRIAERIRSGVELLNFQGKVHVTISGGVAQFSEGNLDQLIQQADQKLYEAKKSGRNIIKGNLDETNN